MLSRYAFLLVLTIGDDLSAAGAFLEGIKMQRDIELIAFSGRKRRREDDSNQASLFAFI